VNKALGAMLAKVGLGVRVRRDVERVGARPDATGVEWWKEDLYTRVPRWYEVVWRGRTLARIPFRESIVGNYFKPADDLVRLVRELVDGDRLRLDAGSRVFEPGCNVGRNLWWLRREFGCEVSGMDISARAVETATTRLWKGPDRARFVVGDVLTPGVLSGFPDAHFDLVLTRWHLIHLPAGEPKTAYVGELKRIARALLILEPTRPGSTGRVERQAGGTYCLSWDDWERAYGLAPFAPAAPLADTSVFLWARRDGG
jgi:SAM-dependent methyltransferase